MMIVLNLVLKLELRVKKCEVIRDVKTRHYLDADRDRERVGDRDRDRERDRSLGE